MIVGTTMDAKSSNFVAMKLIRFLNSVGVNLVWLTHLHKMRTPPSISIVMNKSLEIKAINLAWKNL